MHVSMIPMFDVRLCRLGQLPVPLACRFDLLFVLLDRPDEALDQALSEHVMALHSGESATHGLIAV